MTTIVSDMLKEFYALTAIPRPSGKEERITDYLLSRLEQMGLSPVRDENLHILCDVPATPGYENRPTIALQAHTDMVCVGTDGYCPDSDPVHTILDDEFLRTDGRSSLGADCGIGLASALYAAAHFEHGPLRLIFTADEERGLAGALKLKKSCLKGVDALINLDGFHFGRVFCSSAGGRRQTFTRQPDCFFPMLSKAFTIHISSLLGGHSGDDIGLGRANAGQLLLWLLQSLTIPYELSSIHAGSTHNAIPQEGSACIIIHESDEDALQESLSLFSSGIREIYHSTDPNIQISLAEAEMPQWVLTVDERDDLLALSGLILCGKEEMHPLYPETVGSSGSMGMLVANSEGIEVRSFLRSYDQSFLDMRGDFLAMAAEGFGYNTETQGYPAWPGQESDSLSQPFLSAGAELGIPMAKAAVHVGLETSVFYAMEPELPMVTVGMDILDPHATTERVRLSTIEPFLCILQGVLTKYGV